MLQLSFSLTPFVMLSLTAVNWSDGICELCQAQCSLAEQRRHQGAHTPSESDGKLPVVWDRDADRADGGLHRQGSQICLPPNSLPRELVFFLSPLPTCNNPKQLRMRLCHRQEMMRDKDVLSWMLSAVFCVQPVPESHSVGTVVPATWLTLNHSTENALSASLFSHCRATSTSRRLCLGTAGDLWLFWDQRSPWLSSVLFLVSPSFVVRFLVQCHWAVSSPSLGKKEKHLL